MLRALICFIKGHTQETFAHVEQWRVAADQSFTTVELCCLRCGKVLSIGVDVETGGLSSEGQADSFLQH